MGNFTDEIEKSLKGIIKDIKTDIEKIKPEKYIDIMEEDMKYLDPETEELLKEILDNDKDFPKVLRDKFEIFQKSVNGYFIHQDEDVKLRSKIKLLIDNGYISELKWGDNIPFIGRIEQKGRSYFIMKEQEKIKDFLSWEKVLYNIVKAYNLGKDFIMDQNIGLEMEHIIKYDFATGLCSKTTSQKYNHYVDIRPTVKGIEYIMKKKAGIITNNNYKQKENVFISHSSKDEDFVIRLSQFFQLLGIERNNIFCSSIEGQGVKHGKKIETAVRNEMIEDKILVFVISANFIKSEYCLNELGAGWILSDERIQNKNLFHIKLPGIDFDNIKGFISSGDKCTELNEKSMLAYFYNTHNIYFHIV